jgi:doubled CXXCH motif protein/cytochrome c554/c'-like protein
VASPVEVVLVFAALALATFAILRGAPLPRGRSARSALVVGTFVVTGLSAVALWPRQRPPLPPERPRTSAASPYVSSAACRSCHPGEHASYTRTFHRTMTEDATPTSVLAPLAASSGPLARRGDEIWATDPEGRERRVVLTTGSHREQAYWVHGERAGELRLLPFVWLVRDARFVPRRDAFLTPPEASMPAPRWNSSCIACHAVAGEPRHDEARDAFDTRAAELGIACEACHGPGGAHVAKHRDPFSRTHGPSSRLAGRGDPTIVHPARLSPERSAAVCGQCHAYAFPRDEDGWWTSGYAVSFRAGDPLEPSRILLHPDAGPSAPELDTAMESLFWPDGSIRVGGREYNGLVASGCFARGTGERKMTCLSCHAMHRGNPAGQVAPERAGDAACRSCHAEPRGQEHTHHAAGSVGSACIACHMPKTSYALLSSVRSHRVDSPSAARDARGKPNACNLCHLDKTLEWTADRLASWYGRSRAGAEQDSVHAAGVTLALKGDAAVRVIVADALGDKEAALAAGPARQGWQAAVLAELLVDPYSAVRFVAGRSLMRLPGYSDVGYDFLAPPEVRARVRDDVLARLRHSAPDRVLDPEVVRALLAVRDDRAVTIAE